MSGAQLAGRWKCTHMPRFTRSPMRLGGVINADTGRAQFVCEPSGWAGRLTDDQTLDAMIAAEEQFRGIGYTGEIDWVYPRAQ